MLNKVNGDVITYKVKSKKNKLIVHCCNLQATMGSGVALTLRSTWPIVEELYQDWYQSTFHDDELNDNIPWNLGQVQFVKVEDDVFVGNILGQAYIGPKEIDGTILMPVRWDCIKEAFLHIRKFAKEHDCEIVAPYLGCERAGGKEEDLINLINEVWKDVDVTLVRFTGTKNK